MAKDELLKKELDSLAGVASWYKNTNWGFYTKIVWYSYISIKPFFKGRVCLEMGPADGEMTKFLKNDFKQLVVVDAAEKYVKAAKKLGKNIEGYATLFENFSPTQKFDTIIMSHVLEHVTNPAEILKLAKTWLSPSGRIIVVVPNADSLHRHLGVKLGMLKRVTELNDQDIEIGHRRVYSRKTLDADIKKAGLKNFAKGGVLLKLLSNNQMLTFKDNELIDGMFELGRDFPELCSELYAVCIKG